MRGCTVRADSKIPLHKEMKWNILLLNSLVVRLALYDTCISCLSCAISQKRMINPRKFGSGMLTLHWCTCTQAYTLVACYPNVKISQNLILQFLTSATLFDPGTKQSQQGWTGSRWCNIYMIYIILQCNPGYTCRYQKGLKHNLRPS